MQYLTGNFLGFLTLTVNQILIPNWSYLAKKIVKRNNCLEADGVF